VRRRLEHPDDESSRAGERQSLRPGEQNVDLTRRPSEPDLLPRERRPDAMLVYGEALFVDESGGELFPLEPRAFDVEAMVRACANHVVQPGSLFRRRAWELAGPLNEQGHYLFDFEFALAVGRAGAVVPIPDRLALYRVHPDSKSGGGSLLKARDYVRFADEFLAGSGLPGADQGRGSAYLAAGDYFYDAGELADARRALLR
jgi:hypothetical protein